MQFVFPVNFPPDFQFDVALLATRLSAHTGIGAQGRPVFPGTNTTSIMFENGVCVGLTLFDGVVAVDYNFELSYFEWATIAELQKLGGDIGETEIPQDIAMTWLAYEESRSRRKRWWKFW